MNASFKYRWLGTVLLFGLVYLVVGVAFPNPPASDKTQFIWRLGAWLTCALAFAIHIGIEHFRFRNPPLRTAFHAAAAVSLSAFALAAAANIYALRTGGGSHRLLHLALIIWPIMAGVSSFLVALIAAAVLAIFKENK